MLQNLLKKLVIFLSLLLIASPGYAYLDPGTGSMILQGIIAGVAMASITLKMYWHRFKSFFSRKTATPEEVVEDSEEES